MCVCVCVHAHVCMCVDALICKSWFHQAWATCCLVVFCSCCGYRIKLIEMHIRNSTCNGLLRILVGVCPIFFLFRALPNFSLIEISVLLLIIDNTKTVT